MDAIFLSDNLSVSDSKVEGTVEDHDEVSDHFAVTAKFNGTMELRNKRTSRISKRYAEEITCEALKSSMLVLEFLKKMKTNINPKKLYTTGRINLKKKPQWKVALSETFLVIKNRNALDAHISKGYKEFCKRLEKTYCVNFHSFFKRKARETPTLA